MKSDLINKLDNKQAVIGVVGLGYVGLPLVLRYCQVGYKVLAFDIDQVKVDSLNPASFMRARFGRSEAAGRRH
ncbi:NAD(P)-binding domain-containing protein [Franzmannia qiaohouensis]|uniref:NAD(P)-binding domain-containing protein n=1 Tax=Franzmannia qiaohouensis TaxID=1329370 RepID=A0ABU1HKJ8_9GAMM|nr:NAD(P)-binding domain-containing protein [Halomonas qiaohouensis]MDR5907812.1 NAD(P)-binding domain-containing protein [Halomonas qiaohouensis]